MPSEDYKSLGSIFKSRPWQRKPPKEKKEPPPRNRIAYGYIRVSTQRQQDRGLSPEAQKERLLAWYNYKLKPQGFLWGGVVVEEAMSAWKRDFLGRPRARQLHQRLRRGDIVVVTRSDRAFRSLRDMLNTIELWQTLGIDFCILEMNGQEISTMTAAGKLFLTIRGGFAEFESQINSERTREGHNARRKRLLAQQLPKLLREGKITQAERDAYLAEDPTAEQVAAIKRTKHLLKLRPAGKDQPPAGIKWAGDRGKKYKVKDQKYCERIKLILELRTKHQMSFEAIARYMNRNKLDYPRPPRTAWSQMSVMNAVPLAQILELHEQGKCQNVECPWCKHLPKERRHSPAPVEERKEVGG